MSDVHFHVGMSTLIVITGKISLFALDAYFHSGMPIFTVKIGIRDAYFYVKLGIRDAYFWGCLFSLNTGCHPRKAGELEGLQIVPPLPIVSTPSLQAIRCDDLCELLQNLQKAFTELVSQV